MREDYARQYADLHRTHWWWRGREAIVLGEIDRLPLPRPAAVLDFGCGNGLFLPHLAQLGPVTGLETDRSLVAPDAPLRDRIRHEPIDDPAWDGSAFDLVVALDVLEHLEDDAAAVTRLADLLRPAGLLVVTVPAFAGLWDEHDVVNHHFRRYRRAGLVKLLAGRFRLLRARYLFPSLFAPKLALALINRGRRRPVAQARLPPPWVNAAARSWLVAEDRVARILRPPFGTSVLAVARRE